MNKVKLNKRATLKGALIIALTALLLAVVVPWISSNAMASDNNETDNVKLDAQAVESTVKISPSENIFAKPTEQTFTFSGMADTKVLNMQSSYIEIINSESPDVPVFKNSMEGMKCKVNLQNNTWLSDPQSILIDTPGDYQVKATYDVGSFEVCTFAFTVKSQTPATSKIITVNLDGGTVDPSSVEKLKFMRWNEKGKGIWQRDCTSVQGITHKIALEIWDSPDVVVTKDGQKRTGWNPAPDDSPVTQSATFTAVYGQGNSQVDNPTDSAKTGDSSAVLIFGLVTCAIACSILATRKLKTNKR